MAILRNVRKHTLKATKAWKMFNAASYGDIRRFKGLKDQPAKVAFKKIEESFGKLAELDRNLEALNAECKESLEAVSTVLKEFKSRADT